MKTCVLAILCCLCAQARAQVLVVDGRGQAAGTYWLELTISADGKLTAKAVDGVFRLSDQPAPPSPPDVPDVPTTNLDSAMSRASYEAVKLVTDPNKETTRLHLALLYGEIKNRIGTVFKGPPWQTLATKTKEARIALLDEAGEKQWMPWVIAVTKEFTALERQAPNGQLAADQVSAAYGQLIIGLEHSPDGQARKALDPATKALILKIIRLILEELLGKMTATAAT